MALVALSVASAGSYQPSVSAILSVQLAACSNGSKENNNNGNINNTTQHRYRGRRSYRRENAKTSSALLTKAHAANG